MPFLNVRAILRTIRDRGKEDKRLSPQWAPQISHSQLPISKFKMKNNAFVLSVQS